MGSTLPDEYRKVYRPTKKWLIPVGVDQEEILGLERNREWNPEKKESLEEAQSHVIQMNPTENSGNGSTSKSQKKVVGQTSRNATLFCIGSLFGIIIFVGIVGGLIANVAGAITGLTMGMFICWLNGLVLGCMLRIRIIETGTDGDNILSTILVIDAAIGCVSGGILLGMEKTAMFAIFGGFAVGSFFAMIIGGLLNGDIKWIFHEQRNLKFANYYIGGGIGAIIGGFLGGFAGLYVSKIICGPVGCILAVLVVSIGLGWLIIQWRKRSLLKK